MQSEPTCTRAIACPDRVGIVAAVSRFVAERGVTLARFKDEFAPIAAEFGMDWSIADSTVAKRVVILVSKYDHCRVDLLYRWKSRELACAIACVISHHDDLRGYVEWHGIPYHHIPVEAHAEEKRGAFAEIERIYTDAGADVTVLARYMQILPAELTRKLPGRIINIHHSFLPSFVGARPYHQAFARGVKLIGATRHYVTEELDAGPIIEQDVVRIDHGDTGEDLVRYGRDIEKSVLARALKCHLEDRVLLNGHRTIVFR